LEKPKEIKENIKKLLFVEGNDEVNFFKKMFRDELDITGIQIYPTGGKDQFKEYLPIIVKQRNFDAIKRIGIVQDSDENTKARFDSICHHLKKNGICPPSKLSTFTKNFPSTGIFLLPNNSDNGMLETLCLQSVSDDEKFDCIDNFFKCLNDLDVDIRNYHKAKAQVFLATQKKLIQHVGIGAQKNVWDFEAECMEALKNFLLEI